MPVFNTFFSVGKVCDFHYDCETVGDVSDEEDCPDMFTFNECKNLGDCFWMETVEDDLDWMVATVMDSGESGPNVNFQNSTEGKFLLVHPKGDAVNVGTAELGQRSFYQNSGAQCTLIFYVYILGHNEINLFPQLRALWGASGEHIVTLDRLDKFTVVEGEWTKVEIGIGRQRDQFNVGFVLSYSDAAQPYSAGVAVDDVSLSYCSLPPPEESCAGDQFQCRETKGCVSRDKTCDLTDDCGDGSDEDSLDCDLVTKFDFEDPNKPFGFFTQSAPGAVFKWKRGSSNGTAGVEGTGPAIDHTEFSKDGHYLYIDSGAQTAMDSAYLVSSVIKAEPYGEGCTARVFYHMHGRSVGNLTFYKE